ncbi:MAG TPA: chemotaxis response regulator protein-glutamate methylesterase [Acidisoma sp.]|uniref:protein-glutamate methylesterase/protein-glutamine glutaminase n=1 Tax=Acidisoma sp. TaxID=1872115 RepID=UPI002B9FE890|nr:chemotaxis response regulator protein-glutamate methylesterase [Acidisoma sp.]HTI00237.1 chemotaxis response regulator protein-glutamate methylesterase [Acidisoma sp.]
MTVRVLIVDDSPTMRGVIAARLRSDPEIQVVGQAADPHEARQAIKQLNPDVVTLDIEMPNMDGIAFLDKIMRLRPTPVIMISTLTQRGADISLKALEIGAFDCIPKPSGGNSEEFDQLPEKVKAAAGSRRRMRALVPPTRAEREQFVPDDRIIAIGASTGGVEALITVLSDFPENCPPTIITQHMPATFTRSFAARLNNICPATVTEASDGAPLLPGRIYLAPGDTHLELVNKTPLRCRLTDAPKVNGHRPSVEVMFASVLRSVRSRAIGVILTGMGRDGADGLLAMRQAGCDTIGQDEMSSVVYGMPRVAYEIGAVAKQLPLEQIGSRIIRLANAHHLAARRA